MATKICAATDQLLSAISVFRDRGEFADLQLTHDVESFHVHRIIVCAQSKVFYNACTGGFEEEFKGIIRMNHVHYIELKKMVEFFYSSDYDDCVPGDADISQLQLHARMFALADQYDIPVLSNLAAEKYSKCIALWTPLELLASLRDVYETTPVSIRRLRDTACMAVRKHLPRMLNNSEVAEINPLYGHCYSCNLKQPMDALQGRCKICHKGSSSVD